MKKKLMLIVICIIIIAFIIAREINLKREDINMDSTDEISEEIIKSENYSLENVWIIKTEGSRIEAFVNGEKKIFASRYVLSENVNQILGDLFIENDEVVRISIKPDKISGKVLSMTKKYIEIENYGKIDIEKGFQIYKIYEGVRMGTASEILVGYDSSDFVVSEGKICGAIIKEEMKAKDIRVLLKSNLGGTIFHKEIRLTSDCQYTIYYGTKKKTYEADKVVKIKTDNPLLKAGRIRIKADKEDGRIEILSIQRNKENPRYRGTIEIAPTEEGLTLINEVNLEEYLYSVIPSEMPISYGLEALKVQAVCARSYAYTQLKNNSYRAYGAHVDDSTSYQVYNNSREDKITINAVNETYGQILKYNNKAIPAYYFSTSCGYTASAEDVWMSGEPIGYLVSSFQDIEKQNKKEKDNKIDLSEEKAFARFIKEDNIKTYDSNFAWYRWKTTISVKNLKQGIDQNLKARYAANPELIQTKQNGSYVSVPVDTVGKVKKIRVSKRGTSGIAKELIIEGSVNTIKVISEYNIRSLLASDYNKIERKDGSTISGLGLLPSAFFVIDTTKEDGALESVTFTGGGYGHGVGMSQNGTKAMCDMGKKYDEILKHYYKGIEIGYLYNEEKEGESQ